MRANEIPLFRSEEKLNRAVLRLSKLTGQRASHVFSLFGIDEEYFVIDRGRFLLRPDLARFFFEKKLGRIGNAKWSLITDMGVNLLDFQENPFLFIILLTAILRAVHEHAGLLRISTGSTEEEISFAGDGFGWRAAGDFPHPAISITVIQAVVADSLELLLDEIGDLKPSREKLWQIVVPVLQKHLKTFPADKRKNFSQWIDKKSVAVFEGVLSESELHNLHDFFLEHYVETLQREALLLFKRFQTQAKKNKKTDLFLKANRAAGKLKKLLSQIEGMGLEAKGEIFSELIEPKMAKFRFFIDRLEAVVDNAKR